jgi:hypothetical protein
VCHDGLLVDPRKITTITATPIPTNPTKIKWILGVVGFYQCYFKILLVKQTPMCKLLKKDEEFKWIDAFAKSWEWMKSSMTCLPILIVPN